MPSTRLMPAPVMTIHRATPFLKLALTVFLNREDAERLTAKAIREGKNLDGLVAEILEAESG